MPPHTSDATGSLAKRGSRMIEDFDEEDEPLSRRNSVMRKPSIKTAHLKRVPEDVYSSSPEASTMDARHDSLLKPTLEASAISIRSVSPLRRDIPPKSKPEHPFPVSPPLAGFPPLPAHGYNGAPSPKYVALSPDSNIYSVSPLSRPASLVSVPPPAPSSYRSQSSSRPPSVRQARFEDQPLGRIPSRTGPYTQQKSSLSKEHSASDGSNHGGQNEETIELDYSGAHEKTDPKEVALVRKLDFRIMPMLWAMYFLNYLDRNAIAMARLNGLEWELRLRGSEYQTCVSILFVGYIIGQIPSNLIINRVKPRMFMALAMMAWAITSALTAKANDYTGLLLTRFFLGLAEAPFTPGAVYLLSMFYKRKEVATRLAILYTGNIFATAFAGLIAAGIFHGMHGLAGLSGWRWLFILEGAVTFVVACVGFFYLPDLPLNTWWLTEDERQFAHSRVQLDTTDNSVETDTWSGFKQAVSDPMVWLFSMMGHFHLASNGFKNFFPTVVGTLGYNTTITLVLTCPPYIVAGIVAVAVSWSSGKFNERTWHITASKVVAIGGFIAAASTLNTVGRYVSMMMFTMGTYGANSLIMGWASSVCCQTKEKKAVALAMLTTWMNASQIWTPYLWPRSDSPRYGIAMGTSAAFSFIAAAIAWIVKFMLARRNKKLRESGDNVTVFYVY